MTVLVGEAALRNAVDPTTVMQHQVQHVARLAQSLTHARVGVVPLSRCPILPLHGWEQRDNIISIETTAGDLEIADPDEVAQYERWASLLTDAAVSEHIEQLVTHIEQLMTPAAETVGP